MKKVVSILIASILLAFVTIGGLDVLGMDMGGAHMEMGGGSVDCLDHCLGVASGASTGIATATVSTFAFVVAFVLLFGAWRSAEIALVASAIRWRDGIGIRYRHRELAVVRIQD